MNRMHSVLVLLLVVLITSGCGITNVFDALFGGDDKQALPPVEGNVKGVATKGALSNADILVYTLDAAGNKGTLVTQTTTNANGEWGLDISNTYDLLLIESAGGSYIDESDNEPDIAKKRKITLNADESLYGLIFSGETTAAINILTNSFYEELKRETVKSNDLVYTANMIRQKANNTFGFDVFTLLPTNPIQPSLSASNQQRYYAMLLGGIANAANTAAIQAGQPYMDYEIITALVKDFVDCSIDGMDEGVDISVGIRTLSKEIDLANETLRFRNNNNAAYSSLASLSVDQSEWCQKGPVATVADFTLPIERTVTFTPLNYVSDPNTGDTISLVPGISSLAGATIIDNGDGSFLYTAATAYAGIDQVSYTAIDAYGFKAAGIINIDITDTDSDSDGLTDAQELNLYSTDVNLADSDGDGFSDLHELSAGTDANLASEIPPGTVVGGAINQSVVWNLAGSPYWVQSALDVNFGATLTIERGVVVKFDSATGINVNNGGVLQVNGASTVPSMANVIFTAIDDDTVQGDTSLNGAISPAAGSWNGISFVSGSSGNIDHLAIRWANIGLHVVDASPVFTHFIVENAMTNGIFLEATTGTNSTSFVDAHVKTIDYGAGVLLTSSGGTLAPTFTTSTVKFVSVSYPAVDIQAGSPVFDGVSTETGRFGFSVSGVAGAVIKNGIVYNADEAGIYMNTTGVVEVNGNNIVHNGYGGTQNGGVYLFSAGVGTVIKHNLIRHNNAASGGGVRIDSVNGVLLANNRIIENTASTSGGGVMIWSTAMADIRSNTIVGNQVPAAGDAGGGISSISPSITMTDNILRANRANAIVDDLNTSFIQTNIIQYNMFEETGTGVNAVANNIPNDEGLDPLFVQGWYLGVSSPAFETGSTASFPAYITELGTPITAEAGTVDTGTLDKGVHYTSAPVIVDVSTSTVTPATQATTISSQVSIFITPQDATGVWLGAGQKVDITGAVYGTLSPVIDMGNGIYRATFSTSALTAEFDTLTISVNGLALSTQPYISW